MLRGMTQILLVPTLFLICGVVSHSESTSTTVSDPRPVAKAVEQLEAIYGWPVTYEDPPYVHSGEIVDVTAQVRREQQNVNASGGSRILIPRGGTISFTYENKSHQSGIKAPLSTTYDALRELLRSYSAERGGAEMFRIIQTDELFHVVPVKFTDTSGRLKTIKPFLDMAVSILQKQQTRTGADLLNEICHSLSLGTGRTIVPGTIPLSLFARHATAMTASSETARSVLDRLFKEIGTPLSWQLLYDPGLHWYVLNIHTVASTKI